MRPILCGRTMTAEDLLCDDCRSGCSMAFAHGGVVSHSETWGHAGDVIGSHFGDRDLEPVSIEPEGG